MDDRGHYIKSHQPRAISVNNRYAAFADEDGFVIRGLHDAARDFYDLPLRSGSSQTKTHAILALSEFRTSRLARTQGTHIHIHDVDAGHVEYILRGTGRTVTCLAWSRHDADTLATGMVDGSICIWNTKNVMRPVHRFQSGSGPCTYISFSRVDQAILASSLDDDVAVWSLHNGRKPLWSRSGSGRIYSMDWSPAGTGKLLVASSDGIVKVWDVVQDLKETDDYDSGEESDDDHFGVFGLDDSTPISPPIAQLNFAEPPAHVEWVGSSGIIAFIGSQHEVILFGKSDISNLDEIWHLGLDQGTTAVAIQCADDGNPIITGINWDQCQIHKLPPDLHDALEWHDQRPTSYMIASSDYKLSHSKARGKTDSNYLQISDTSGRMKPVTIAHLRGQKTGFEKTSRQLQQRRLNISRSPTEIGTVRNDDSIRSIPSSPTPGAMKSNLDLPSDQEDDSESRMPFLSPGIPARQSLNGLLLPLDDTMDLEPLESNPSFDSLPETADQNKEDSDSDEDDTFAEGMRGSGTFMPGSLNVPLPKAGGALFAPNGQLVVFLPPKPKAASVLEDDINGSEPDAKRGQVKVAKLFPTFGNLAGDVLGKKDDGSDSDDSNPTSPNQGFPVPSFAVHPASYQSQQSWKLKFSPAEPALEQAEGKHGVVVSIQDVHTLLPGCRTSAEQYRVLCKENESGSDLCYHNGKVAKECGLSDTAEIWRLLAMVLEDRVPLEMLTMNDDADDVVVVARKVTSILRSSLGYDMRNNTENNTRRGKLRWSDHPFGASWVARRTLAWAEQRADVQLLACISAILAEAQAAAASKDVVASRSISTKLPSTSVDYFSNFERTPLIRGTPPPIPVLRTNSTPISPALKETPPKSRQISRGNSQVNSRGSSRNASRATTPYGDSLNGTPPFILPPLSRHNSRLSASGSASPEQHRSSFSAAAKYYAQSITDKFSTYGTSPPTKKLRASPSSNELSSSLPMPSGSWGKSVSFASTVDTAKESPLSSSYTHTEEVEEEEEYDSDRTIDDSSVPVTPKSPLVGDVMIKMKDRDAFSDEISGGARAALLPPDLAAKSVIWRSCFAEQLRTWNRFVQAAEIEKAAESESKDSAKPQEWDGIVPVHVTKSRLPTCSICYSTISGLKQLCPTCLHATHLECLEEHLMFLNLTPYSCPTGCGCACDQLPFEPIDIAPIPEPVDEAKEMPKLFSRRKTSFTDPRRWRSRIDGDSW